MIPLKTRSQSLEDKTAEEEKMREGKETKEAKKTPAISDPIAL